jgi:hypothetical protein
MFISLEWNLLWLFKKFVHLRKYSSVPLNISMFLRHIQPYSAMYICIHIYWTVLASKPVVDENLRTRTTRTAANQPHVIRERVTIFRIKLSVRDFKHPISCSGKVKGRVEANLYSISGLSGLLWDNIWSYKMPSFIEIWNQLLILHFCKKSDYTNFYPYCCKPIDC